MAQGFREVRQTSAARGLGNRQDGTISGQGGCRDATSDASPPGVDPGTTQGRQRLLIVPGHPCRRRGVERGRQSLQGGEVVGRVGAIELATNGQIVSESTDRERNACISEKDDLAKDVEGRARAANSMAIG
jgi:hypothetical protein